MEKIDAHHHFWIYTSEEYDWISDDMAAIRRDYLPTDLRETIAGAGVDGVVTVQARQSLEETDWLLEMAAENEFIRAVVGWVPLMDPKIEECLEYYAPDPKFRAVRHVIQGEPDDNFILGDAFNRGVALLKEWGLVYDILILERHLPQTIEFVDRHPYQEFVLNHIAKPRIAENLLEPWATNLRELARRDNVYCKLSGMVSEADPTGWTEDQMRPYMETVLEAFGPRRVMFGSDWPVCLVGCEYARWHDLVSRFINQLSDDEQARVLGGTALEAYSVQ
ncbi:MAG: amidohydrolase family protein [Victivallales bacterium]|nr:amidohydrolase family protein [Victivallales bacterium]